MSTQVKLLDVVALTEEVTQHGLRRGQVGTVVEMFGGDVFEVEFADNQGRTYATVSLRGGQLMPLHYQSA